MKDNNNTLNKLDHIYDSNDINLDQSEDNNYKSSLFNSSNFSYSSVEAPSKK